MTCNTWVERDCLKVIQLLQKQKQANPIHLLTFMAPRVDFFVLEFQTAIFNFVSSMISMNVLQPDLYCLAMLDRADHEFCIAGKFVELMPLILSPSCLHPLCVFPADTTNKKQCWSCQDFMKFKKRCEGAWCKVTKYHCSNCSANKYFLRN